MLRLRKKQYSPPGTGRVHRGANQGISADRQNDGIGTTALGEFADTVYHIHPRSFHCKV